MNSQQMTVSEVLQKAIAAHRAGNFRDAERFYRSILQVQPNHPAVNHNIGVLAAQAGKPEMGLPYLERALKMNPNRHQFWITYVETLIKIHDFDNALMALDRAKSLGLATELIKKLELILLQGKENLSFQSNKIDSVNKNNENWSQYSASDDEVTLQNCVIQQFESGNYAEAERISRNFIQRYPCVAFGYKALGAILTQHQKNEEAVTVLEKGLNYSTDDPELYNALATAFKNLGKFEEALLNYKRAVEINPDFVEAYNNIGIVFKKRGMLDEAIVYYSKALELKADYAEAYYNTGNALKELGKFDEALVNYSKALELKPDCAVVYNNMGLALKELGRLDEALWTFEKVLKIKPDFAEAYYNASDMKEFLFKDSVLSELNTILNSSKSVVEEKMYAHFALGNLYNKNKNYHDAFMNFELGHIFRRDINKSEGHPYRHDLCLEKLSFSKKNFTPQFFVDRKDWGLFVDTPIFIVGFPRSGTSLVEQILSSHSAVYGGGELKYISQFALSCVDFDDTKTFEQFLHCIDRDKLLNFSSLYLEKIKTISNNSKFVTDKMPHNFEYLWFISLLFQNVTILHCTRSPEDTCLSCYCNKFTEHHEYIDSLQDLAKHYKYYLEIMNFWKSVLPIPIHDISYEALVHDPEAEIRNILSLCNLDFEGQCLEFYKTKRPVITASATQVREKMYTSSIGKWKRYEPFIGSLLDELYTK